MGVWFREEMAVWFKLLCQERESVTVVDTKT